MKPSVGIGAVLITLLTLFSSFAEASTAQQDFSQGFELIRAGRLKAAAAKFEHGLKMEPCNAQAHFYLAETYLGQKQNDAAEAHYQKSLELDPSGPMAQDAKNRLEIISSGGAKKKMPYPGDAEITEYFNAHPELFAERKIYKLQEISIKAPKAKQESIRAQVAASQTLKDFMAWLKASKFKVKTTLGVKPAEGLPMDLVPKLAGMSDGQAIIVNTAEDVLVVIVLDSSRTQPVTLEQATPPIRNFLQAQSLKTIEGSKALLAATRQCANKQ